MTWPFQVEAEERKVAQGEFEGRILICIHVDVQINNTKYVD